MILNSLPKEGCFEYNLNMTFYTYLHRRESDNQPFYIGKGQKRRAWQHSGRNRYWTSIVGKHGLKVEICAEWHTEAEAFEHEKFLISCFKGMSFDGGEGPSGMVMSAEHKASVSAAQKGRHVSELTRKRISKAKLGVKRTDEQRAKISESITGRELSDEHRAKISALFKGVEKSSDHRSKIAAALAGVPLSADRRAKISASLKGAKVSDEARVKIAAALTGKRWVNNGATQLFIAKGEATPEGFVSGMLKRPKTNESLEKEMV
jgi:hypothetical protein